MRTNRQYACLLILLLLSWLLAAREGPRIIGFTPEDYAGQPQNWAFAQDSLGNLYAANSGRILRFDGVRWTKFQLPGNPIVRSICMHNGKLYAGGYGEFGYFQDLHAATPEYISLSDQFFGPERMREEIWH
ncbi:MAG: hypothetical protein AAFU67_19290, partial [Bacteroidota bacterium]